MAAWQLYDQFRKRQNNGNAINLDTPGGNGFKVALVTSSYTPAQDTDDFWSDVSANEVSGDNYTAGGNACSSPGLTGPTAGLLTFDAANPATWSQHATGFTNARYAIFYLDTGTASTSGLLCYLDLTSDRGNVAGDFSITFATEGVFNLPRAA